MTTRITADILVEAFCLAKPDFDDLKDRIEDAAAAHKATVTVDGRLYLAPQSAAPSAPVDRASVLREAADVRGRCPACGRESLFLGSGGYVTCRQLACPEPDAASTLLEQRPAPPGVRERYIEAIDACRTLTPAALADAVLAVRDEELAQLRAGLAALWAVRTSCCPHCGRGDASPTPDQHLEQVRRAETAEAERDGAYRERACLVAHLASCHPSHIGHTDPSAPDWAVVIIETPAGQMSWHIAERDLPLFAHVQPTGQHSRGWDGHTTDEKYQRLEQLRDALAKQDAAVDAALAKADRDCDDHLQAGRTFRDRAASAEAAIVRVREACDRLARSVLNVDGMPLSARDKAMYTATQRVLAALDEPPATPDHPTRRTPMTDNDLAAHLRQLEADIEDARRALAAAKSHFDGLCDEYAALKRAEREENR
jgi:hypothetical protein